MLPIFDENCPTIPDWDDLMTREETAKFFGITTNTLDHWKYGSEGRPPLPYLRLKKIYFSKTQMVWWMNLIQRTMIDRHHIDRMERIKKGLPVGRPRPRKNKDQGPV